MAIFGVYCTCMDTAAEALLIVVSATLTVFLILFCIALVYFIRLLKKADHVANSVESAASAVKRSATTAAPLTKLFTNLFSKSSERKD